MNMSAQVFSHAARIDQPTPFTPVDALCFPVEGWAWLGSVQDQLVGIEAWVDDQLIGETFAQVERPDVQAHLGIGSADLGFRLFCHYPNGIGRVFQFHINARLRDGTRVGPLTSAEASGISKDYRDADYGVMLNQQTIATQRRANIYTSGPSTLGGSAEVCGVLRRYLGNNKKRVLDVGCGCGFYGQYLLSIGHDWIGAEVKDTDCAVLKERGLPHVQVNGKELPFPDGHFEAATCLEVLEHIDDPHQFLREVARVSPRELIVSVPNCELLSYLSGHLAVPWHMLEGDHKNFFTRWSMTYLLKQYYKTVEISYYREHPLKTPEGTALFYHILAVARS